MVKEQDVEISPSPSRGRVGVGDRRISQSITRNLFIAALAFAVSACNTGLSTLPPEQLNPGSLTADLETGFSFISSNAQAVNTDTTYIIGAIQNVAGRPQDEINLIIPKSATVPYVVTTSDRMSAVTYYDAATSEQYFARPGQGMLSITVTALTPTIQGTFSATTTASGATDSVRVLSNGAFNATY